VSEVLTASTVVAPSRVVDEMVETGAYKASIPARNLVVRAGLASFVFGAVTTLAGTVVTQTGIPFAGALVFPIALVIVILLGLELVTSTMGLVPLAWWRGRATGRDVVRSIGLAVLAHAVGSAIFALVFWATVTEMGTVIDSPVAVWIRDLAEHKTIHYASMGVGAGLSLVVIKAVLCNWLVSLAAVLGMTSRTTGGKIAAIWLPITLFFGLGYEHSVVNLFVIPAGMLVGADVTFADWWLWNQIPVLLGNLVGAATLTGLGMWVAQRPGLPWVRR
jgi:formate/nitrite transporter